MKIRTIIAAIIAVAVVSSCAKKLDEKVLGDLTNLKTTWDETTTTASDWSNTLKAEVAMLDSGAIKLKADREALKNPAKTAVASLDSVVAACAADAQKGKDIVASWETFSADWTAQTSAFSDFKAKVEKMEVSADSIPAQLATFQSKLDESKSKLEEWKSTLNTLKSNCDAHKAKFTELSAAPAPKGKK